MCAIVGSRDSKKLRELVELNSYRGQHSHSFSLFNYGTGTLNVVSQQLGPIDLDKIVVPEYYYGIVHVQAPTSDTKDTTSIHPAILNGWYLWHNGIIKASVVEKLRAKKYPNYINWDTLIMLLDISGGWKGLNEMDGTFSCLLQKERKLFLFRNEISPMFVDRELNISSTKFDGSVSTEPNTVLRMKFFDNTMDNVYNFKTVENPYYFGE